MWHAIARLLGGVARAAGRNAASARELEPEHRRDGAALGVVAFGLVAAMAIWFHAAGPVGRFIESLVRLHVVGADLDAAYRQMAREETREAEALEWAEATLGNIADEAR